MKLRSSSNKSNTVHNSCYEKDSSSFQALNFSPVSSVYKQRDQPLNTDISLNREINTHYFQNDEICQLDYSEDYFTDDEMVTALFKANNYNPEKLALNFMPLEQSKDLSNMRVPLLIITPKMESLIQSKRSYKQEFRARKSELILKTKSLMIPKAPEITVCQFICTECHQRFSTGQSLGGHMSKRHPGKSDQYLFKKETRKRRLRDRIKLVLAKKRYYEELDYDYEEMTKSIEGKSELKKLINRGKIRSLKETIGQREIDDYIKDQDKMKKFIE